MAEEMRIRVQDLYPSDPDAWNRLAASCSNLQQSTWVDASQAYFKQTAVFIEVWKDDQLLGGLKCYLYQSRRPLIRWINTYLQQTGEMLIHPDSEEAETIKTHCFEQLRELIRSRNLVFSKHSMHYGYAGLIPDANFARVYSSSAYTIGYVDLNQSVDELWKNIPAKRKRKIREAEKQGLVFEEADNPGEFFRLLEATYSKQDKNGPDTRYLQQLYSDLKEQGIMKLYFIRDAETYVAGAMMAMFGKTAYYSFGGVTRDSRGAGKLLHWTLFQKLKEEGYESYCFGQLAAGVDLDNEKFTLGITSFKRRWGLLEFPASSITFVYKPFSYFVWRMLLKLIG